MALSNISDLLACDPSNIAIAEFVGNLWEPFGVRNAVLDLATGGQLDLGVVRERLPALLQRLRVDPETLNSTDDVVRVRATAQAFGADWRASPSPLLALTLLTAALEAARAHPTEHELALLAAYSAALLHGVSSGDALAPVVSAHISDICRVYNRAGAFDMSLRLAETSVLLVRQQLASSVAALPDLMDSLYDARTGQSDAAPPVGADARRRVAEKMLAFIDDEMAPALEARNAFFGRSSSDSVAREIRRSTLALQHRRLTQESAKAHSTIGWSSALACDWKALVEGFEALGDREGRINAVNAASAGLDGLLQVPSKKRSEGWSEEVRRLTEYVREGIEAAQSHEDRRSLLRRVAAAEIELQDADASEAALRRIEASLREELDGLDGQDDATRSYLLSGADDFLGLALRRAGPGDQLVRDLFELLRGYELPNVKPPASASLARLFVTRTGSLIQLLDEHESFFRGTSSHDLAVALQDLSSLIRSEIRDNQKTRKAPGTATAWREHVERLSGRVGVSAMAAARKSPDQLLIEADGLAVHVAVSGLFLNAWPDIRAIAATRLGHNVEAMALPGTKRTAVVNCFSPGEAWSRTLEGVGRTLGATACRVTTTDEFLAALQQEASLLIVGAHGSQDGVAGPLTLSVGGRAHPIEDLLSSHRFAKGVTVVAAVCYGAAGQGHFAGRWSSLPEILTTCGARWVIANRWPAWTEPATEADFVAFMKALEVGSVSDDVWTVPRATTEFMRALKNKGNDPRQWAGWTAWSAVDELRG